VRLKRLLNGEGRHYKGRPSLTLGATETLLSPAHVYSSN
jgi:hypothetical protein